MEPIGAASDPNWNSFGAMVTPEDSEIMALLFGNIPFSDDPHRENSLEMPSMYWSSTDHDMVSPYYSSNEVNSSFSYWPQQGSTNNPSDIESYYFSDPAATPASNADVMPMDFFMVEERSNASSFPAGSETLREEPSCFLDETGSGGPVESGTDPSELIISPDHQKPPPKRRLPMPEPDTPAVHGNKSNSVWSSKKKSRAASADVQKNGKSTAVQQSKRNQKSNKTSESEECNNTSTLVRQASVSYSSEDDDSSESQENNGGEGTKGSTSSKSSAKTRAGRGSATDPQSLYARKRRERINERLRILQNLVPNGTKVDISTMLEEAVQYVKFLQLQIKLLSSDDLWMYSPIAYNGMDIGLDLKISPPQWHT